MHAHAKLDAAVAAAYGWAADLSDEGILEHLLVLNLERGADEEREKKTIRRKPSARAKTTDVLKYRERGFKPDEIAIQLGIGRASVYRIIKDADAL